MPDGFVIEGNIDLSDRGLTKLPNMSNVRIAGEFTISRNKLTTLEGAPKYCHDFYCNQNELTSLKHGPKGVFGHYVAWGNKLTTLEGAPERVRYFDCKRNNLTSLKYGSKLVTEEYSVDNNDLKSLEGGFCPESEYVSYDMDGEREICNRFSFEGNKNLKSLHQMPECNKFYCDNRELLGEYELDDVSKWVDGPADDAEYGRYYDDLKESPKFKKEQKEYEEIPDKVEHKLTSLKRKLIEIKKEEYKEKIQKKNDNKEHDTNIRQMSNNTKQKIMNNKKSRD